MGTSMAAVDLTIDMLLNHNHYIKAKNVFSAQCSILCVSRDIIDLTSLRRQIND